MSEAPPSTLRNVYTKFLVGNEIREFPQAMVAPFPDPFTIAIGATPFQGFEKFVSEGNSKKIVYFPNPHLESQLCDFQLDVVQYSEQYQPDVVLLPEMSFPYQPESVEGQMYIQSLLNATKESRNTYIFAGTTHTLDFRNVAVVCSPDGRLLYLFKHNSAKRVGEFIQTFVESGTIVNSGFGRFAMLICLDAYDLALTMPLELLNTDAPSHERVPIVLVPAYEVGNIDKFLSNCADLSFYTKTVLAVSHSGSKASGHALYLCGERTQPVDEVPDCGIYQISVEQFWNKLN